MNAHEVSALNAFGRIDPLVHEPARLMILASLYLSDTHEAPSLQRITGLSWGNFSAHLSKLEKAGFVQVAKYFKGKRPSSTVILTDRGRYAFSNWKRNISQGIRHLDAVIPDATNIAGECRIHVLPMPDSPWQHRFSLRERPLPSPAGRWVFPLHNLPAPETLSQSV